MRPTLDEARLKFALEMLSDETGREKKDLLEEIDEKAEQYRSR